MRPKDAIAFDPCGSRQMERQTCRKYVRWASLLTKIKIRKAVYGDNNYKVGFTKNGKSRDKYFL